MTKKKIILVFSLLFCQLLFCQQFNDITFLYNGKLDSVSISTFYKHNKETSIVGDTIPDEKILLLKKRLLKKKEISDLLAFLKDKKAYSKKVPLLNDYDIEIVFFVENRIVQEINVSSLTKKISIKREECPYKSEKDTINKCLYYARISKSFENFILKLTSKEELKYEIK